MPSSILWNRRLLATLSWQEIDDLMLTTRERWLLKGDCSLDDIEYRIRRDRESELLRYRSRNGLLDVDQVEPTLFRQQFRFEKRDLSELVRLLLIPDKICSAQKVTVVGRDALCLLLRRLAYPNRWCDLQEIFGLHTSVMSSVSSQVVTHITATFGHLLEDMNNHSWLSSECLRDFADAVRRKGATLDNCWAFIDGTARAICRPKRNQQAYFSGHKRVHCVKYQSLMCPNGIVCQLDGHYPGRRHDAGILRDSGLYAKLERLVNGQDFVIYGDPAYPLLPLIMKPYTAAQPESVLLPTPASSLQEPNAWPPWRTPFLS
ncbi:uncharacterized protein LOC125945714 [Dermacentor silvarum]|nr:uncharacterized protein LOC125945714 [Dermacentor silvarum]